MIAVTIQIHKSHPLAYHKSRILEGYIYGNIPNTDSNKDEL